MIGTRAPKGCDSDVKRFSTIVLSGSATLGSNVPLPAKSKLLTGGQLIRMSK